MDRPELVVVVVFFKLSGTGNDFAPHFLPHESDPFQSHGIFGGSFFGNVKKFVDPCDLFGPVDLGPDLIP